MWDVKLHIFGHARTLYSVCNTLGAVVMLVYNLLRAGTNAAPRSFLRPVMRHHGSDTLSDRRYRALPETLLADLLLLGLCVGFNMGWAKLSMRENANYYGIIYFAGPAFLGVCVLLGLRPLKTLDRLTPSLPLMLTVWKLGCFCEGCCHGREMYSSFYYSLARSRYEFPVQLVEMAAALGMFLYLSRREKKPHREGSQFPLYALLYSATRFFTDFLREMTPVLGPLSLYQLQALAGVAVGAAELILLQKGWGDRELLKEGWDRWSRKSKGFHRRH